MAKRPRPGSTKTRLTPTLTSEDAARLAQAFLLDTVDLVDTVPGATSAVAFSPPDAETEQYFAETLPTTIRIPQVGDDLSQRLAHVMTSGLDLGFQSIVAINADGPTLPASSITQAFKLLETDAADVVLGPTADGGYYLIGWVAPHPLIVTGVTMSTPTVLDDTLALCAKLNLRTALTPPWYDVDTVEDLNRLRQELSSGGNSLAPHTRAALLAMSLPPESRDDD